MDIQSALDALTKSGLNFSIEMNGRAVLVWVGDYVRESAAAASLDTLDQALEWLGRFPKTS